MDWVVGGARKRMLSLFSCGPLLVGHGVLAVTRVIRLWLGVRGRRKNEYGGKW